MNLFSELKKDHKRIKDLCSRVKKEENGSKKRQLKSFLELADLLSHHSFAEEESLYARLKPEGGKAKDLSLEGYEEHHVADFLIGELKNLAVEDERWKPKFEVLTEALEHHIKEEENAIFDIARKKLSKEVILQAGEQFLTLKKSGDSVPDKSTWSGAQRTYGAVARQ